MKSVSCLQILSSPDSFQYLPPAVVFGAGMTEFEPGPQTVANAEAAATLLRSGLLDNRFVVTTGYGPDNGLTYPVTEAAAMAEIITKETYGNPRTPTEIYMEPCSRDTFGSIWNIASFVEGNAMGALTLIGAEYHVSRAAFMARRIFGKHVEIVPVHSVDVTSPLAIAKEMAMMSLYAAVSCGAKNTAEHQRAMNTYRKVVRGPKEVVSRLRPEGSRYGRSRPAA